jgi:ADP-ribose pyrophosphatase
VAVTARGEVVLVRQYRHAVRRTLLELPAGKIDPGESPLTAAKRELLEETGYASRRWIRLGAWYPSPASTTLKSNMYLALNARRVRVPAPEPNEFLRVEVHPFARMVRQVGRLAAVPLTFNFGLLLAERYLHDHPGSAR